MAILKDYYNTGDDTGTHFGDSTWEAQSFTTTSAYSVGSVKLKLSQGADGSPGTITVSIRATDVNGHPTGADLASGTYNGDTLPAFVLSPTAAVWVEIKFSSPYSLSSGVKYAIVVRCVGAGSPSNALYWRSDGTSPAYTNGIAIDSYDAGVNWSDYAQDDFMFEVWEAGFPYSQAHIIG